MGCKITDNQVHFVGVPHIVLVSKKESSAYYSVLMASRAGSTVAIADNFAAIEAFCTGKTVAENPRGISVNMAMRPTT